MKKYYLSNPNNQEHWVKRIFDEKHKLITLKCSCCDGIFKATKQVISCPYCDSNITPDWHIYREEG